MRSNGLPKGRFDVEEGEEFKVLKKIGEKGRAFRVVNERGQLGHLQRELVVCWSLYFFMKVILQVVIILQLQVNL